MDINTARIIFIGMTVFFILAWKPLHRRFRGWAIVAAYLILLFVLATYGDLKPDERWMSWLIAASSVLVLFANRQKPIEERRPTVAFMVVHGLWDMLAKEGLPPDEIERLKRLTPEERERLMAVLMRPVEKYTRVRHIYGTFPGDYVWDDSEHF